MRTYGRSPSNIGPNWVQVTTNPASGENDHVYLTTLCQVLLLILNESPFYANYGIPAFQSVMTQIYPDYYVAVTQRQFAQYFASLSITRRTKALNSEELIYEIACTTKQGTRLIASVPIPT